MCSGPEAGSYLRLIDFVYHSTLGLKVIMKKKKIEKARSPPPVSQTLCPHVYRGTSLIRNCTPPRTAIGPYAYAYYRVLGSGVFL